MQTDMHFYGTYVLARAAGLLPAHAKTLAYAAQFVDDSTQQDSEPHPDKGLLYGIATAHHDSQCVLNRLVEADEQRRVWVPFHFLPGGDGESLEEKLLCVKNSQIAREMVGHHIKKALDQPFGFELMGIAAHVYMDTFSHYGFSGISSEYNKVDEDSFELIEVKNEEMERYLLDKKGAFINKYGLRSFTSSLIEKGTGALGHGAVATYPDRPFLHWRVTFEKKRPKNGTLSDRDNPKTYLEGCEELHRYLSSFAHQYYVDNPVVQQPFSSFREKVNEILRFEGKKEDRVQQWRSAIERGVIYPPEPDEERITYSFEEWENEKSQFSKYPSSKEAIRTHIYQFHQAAALHRYYVLKELLPAHGIAVY